MQLNRAGLADKIAWEAKGYALPSFDYETVKKIQKRIHSGFTSVLVISSVHSSATLSRTF